MGSLLRRPVGDKSSQPLPPCLIRGRHPREVHIGLLELGNVEKNLEVALGSRGAAIKIVASV